jgi:transcriptional regulator with XRE-family HTH domain
MTEIPDTNGLVAAVAITRCLLPLSLSGAEIKFVRKALEMTGREFAELMETRPETVSRWETDDQAIGGFVEKILRQKVCERLKGRAPAVDYEPAMIIDLTLLDHRKSDPLPRLVFERVLFKSYGQRHKALHWDVVTTADVKNAA